MCQLLKNRFKFVDNPKKCLSKFMYKNILILKSLKNVKAAKF